MAPPEQVLIIEPSSELRFKGPFTDVVTAELKLTNPSEKRVCFKVKTTAPKRYCVRPNSGIIDPSGSVVVSVMLQPFDYDPNEKNKHKFMVQTMFAPDSKIESQENLWKEAKPDQLMDSKLKCVFEMPGQQQQSGEPVVEEKVKPVQDTSHTESKQETPAPAPIPAKPSPPPTSSLGAQPTDLRSLQTQLRELQEQNSILKQEGMRLRKVAMSDTVSSTPTAASVPPSTLPGGLSPLSYGYILLALIIGVVIGKLIL